ncbi:MAG TPA: hypothetical protein VE974_20465 [Thermoanaerobaculia bacterium]|nr:hypothetical protein [Thermoanaerobaculia bacterium]
MTDLHEIRFRSSPHLDLRQLSELTGEQREPFRELENDPEFYGLFVPRPPLAMNLKSVGRQTAELFHTLAAPSHIDPALLGDRDYAEDVIDLVLDGILEIESVDGFLSGADALPVVCPPIVTPDPRDAVARLSLDALLHAQDLETADPQALTTALYLYNRIPMSTFWKTRFPDGEAVRAHLGADRGALRALLECDWVHSVTTGWLNWSPKTRIPRNDDDVTYKLYVSPRPERIREAFEVVVRVLAAFPGAQFKIGDSAVGLLRPDKLVTYFTSREQLGEAASVLRRELAGCEAHGIPFTAGLDDTGLLSWGVDPPENDRALRWLHRESWRFWVVQRLGAAMSLAKHARSAGAVEPWRFALERARRQGVDVETWTPSATLWSTP